MNSMLKAIHITSIGTGCLYLQSSLCCFLFIKKKKRQYFKSHFIEKMFSDPKKHLQLEYNLIPQNKEERGKCPINVFCAAIFAAKINNVLTLFSPPTHAMWHICRFIYFLIICPAGYNIT